MTTWGVGWAQFWYHDSLARGTWAPGGLIVTVRIA